MARGRKPKGEFHGKSETFTTRITPETRRALERAAAKSGRSLSQEVETRIKRSFADDGKIHERFGDLRTYAFFRMLQLPVRVLGLHGARRRRFWLEDRYQYIQVATAIKALLDDFEPKGSRGPKDEVEPELTGLLNADHVLRAIKAGESPPADWSEELRNSVKDILFEPGIPSNIHQLLKHYLDRTSGEFLLSALRRKHGRKSS